MAKYNYGFIAGHGYNDPGAIGNGYKEAERVRYIGKFIVKHFNKITNVKMTMVNGNNDVFQDQNIEIISKDYDQLFEGHLNAITSSSANGTETLVFLSGIDKIDEATLKANSKFWSNRGFKDGSWVRNAIYSQCPYRLIEFCFITNKNDISIFNKKADEIAKELAIEVAEAIGEKYVENDKTEYTVVKIKTQYRYNEKLHAGYYYEENTNQKYGFYYGYSEKTGKNNSDTFLNINDDNCYYFDINHKGVRYHTPKTSKIWLYKDENLTKKVIENGEHKFMNFTGKNKNKKFYTKFIKNITK